MKNMDFLWSAEEIKPTEQDKKIRDIVFEKGQKIIWIQEKDKAWMLAVLYIIQTDTYYQEMDQVDQIHTITTTLQELNAHPDKFLIRLKNNHLNKYHKIMLLKETSLNQ